ncbi:response regulator [Flavobacterium sp. NST-5]|uniref:Response regulator n=1 Tax=Flavobacterium ichthyis TaxID=2698827 RepID=A0ABW9Z8F5_9FLAO|nr:response regulator transcription factor [Flavobacterium ichthyis]NBL64996.1 response regulator [Flavobacterium ichthyis]
MTSQTKYKIIIVDDHLLFSQSLELLINNFQNFEVINSFENGKEFVKHFLASKKLVADLVLLDVNMPIMNGIDTMIWLKEHFPDQKVLALSVNEDEEIILKMVRLGTRGYLLKDTSPKIFEKAMLMTIEEGYFFTEMVSKLLVNGITKPEQDVKLELKEKELEFVKLACTDKTYKEIADEMHLSPKTIDGYRENVFVKTDVKNRIGLVLYAIKNKLITL